jgi:hypothetical protein
MPSLGDGLILNVCALAPKPGEVKAKPAGSKSCQAVKKEVGINQRQEFQAEFDLFL